ncbi:hypothetical protein B7P43_G11870 [Cryptotermes secundus]|uniref:RRM domain-containing protein n=1 Tax=Cryptotermes secundus TaxID=105785 RepID=A0A2J7QHQ9_9NEOP|nr:uncharacterized protein LOC111867467 isoform X1 [Cryptotermes secundus]XP_033608585.1 uncharacterized protein LOC111867467 isoform X1 [Cryptotermes secundus]PNF28121.1 hypothetical protein B7P43_G11870 [Cryptotermes secundus]
MSTEIHRGADGLFAVCFRNYKAYDENKILEIFGRYGRVVSVRFSGKESTGMVFVRYREYNETRNCLEDLNRRQELNVKLANYRPPLLDGPKQQSGSKDCDWMFVLGHAGAVCPAPITTSNYPPTRWGTTRFLPPLYKSPGQIDGWVMDRQSFRLPMNNNFARNQCSSTYNGPRKKFQQNFMQNDFKKRNFQQKYKNHHTENENCEEPKQNDEQNNIKSEVPEPEEPLNNEEANGSDDINDKGGTKEETTINKANVDHPGNEGDLKNSDSSDQISQENHTSNDVIDDGPPPLVDFEDMPDLVGERPIVYGKDIIISNLPPSVNLHDVMLLTKRLALNPVHISPIETTGIKYNIPFCHLWVKNEYEAEIAVSALQGIRMAGNKLLVARAEKLLNTFKLPVDV